MIGEKVIVVIAVIVYSANAAKNGEWLCGFPGTPLHGTVTSTDAGRRAVYNCEPGYKLLGPSERVCSDANSTEWTPSGVPFCVVNVAAKQPSTQSSTIHNASSHLAVDGQLSIDEKNLQCTRTQDEVKPWWLVDTIQEYLVKIVEVHFGLTIETPVVVEIRVGNRVSRGDGDIPLCHRYQGPIVSRKPFFFKCAKRVSGRYVSVVLTALGGEKLPLSLCEVMVYSDKIILPGNVCNPPKSAALTLLFNGVCYYFYLNNDMTFSSARFFCDDEGQEMLRDVDAPVQQFLAWNLQKVASGSRFWLGIVRNDQTRNKWMWVNSDPIESGLWAHHAIHGDRALCAKMDGKDNWRWSDAECDEKMNFVCQKEPSSCGLPKLSPHVQLNGSVDVMETGSKLKIECEDGFITENDNEEMSCLANGNFREPVPRCKILHCSYPPSVENAFYVIQSGGRARYSCIEGFHLKGVEELHCDIQSKTWIGNVPSCRRNFRPFEAIRFGNKPLSERLIEPIPGINTVALVMLSITTVALSMSGVVAVVCLVKWTLCKR